MECKFQVGDQVVCIHEMLPITQILCGFRGPVLDEIYHVSNIFVCGCGMGHILIHLREIQIPPGFNTEGFHHTSFRKLLTIEDFKSTDVGLPVDSVEKVVEHV